MSIDPWGNSDDCCEVLLKSLDSVLMVRAVDKARL